MRFKEDHQDQRPGGAALHDWLTSMRSNLIDAYENYNTCVA